jgi:hypothetical protein
MCVWTGQEQIPADGRNDEPDMGERAYSPCLMRMSLQRFSLIIIQIGAGFVYAGMEYSDREIFHTAANRITTRGFEQ